MPLVPRPGLDRIQPYQPGQRPIGGGGPGVKLSANESALGPSPKAMAAYADAAGVIERYPDANAVGIRQALADRYGLKVENILMGIGSDELLSALVRTYAGAGDEVLYPTATFPMYRIYALSTGADIVQAPDAGYRADVDALLAAVTERTKVVIVANPNNPTGTYLPADEMARLRDGLRDDILLIIDAAYAEYVTKTDYDAGIALVDGTDNTVMTRTFSKVHGMASLRIGWCYAHADIVSLVGRIRSPFNVSSAGQAAGIAALVDKTHEDTVVAHTAKWHGIATQRLSALGLEITGTEGNFVCVGFPDEDGKRAKDADAFLRKSDIITRGMAGFGLPKHLRVTIGTDEEMEVCIDAIEAFVRAW
ncbi:MAG: histidinol-phosphate transaminase [Rhodospirillaceae bacterium]|jgi:histidinol-phosphate aminotransferase|nr:histidinol-phosphate transaminase [Rhodospirillaceae bacterium]MBT5564420.1 histidinol-phosphate transaminase [Rhodospirillaceae bacterium]MBT6089711.1 histidinol-phosphate transaminase [Rhodospirillaceae bacterium]MBT7450385.1 histidinol-phosphate transaminase [Rhodospirillaceae bacterium]